METEEITSIIGANSVPRFAEAVGLVSRVVARSQSALGSDRFAHFVSDFNFRASMQQGEARRRIAPPKPRKLRSQTLP
ncbi:hypothetical protein FOTG_10738 [Fusarium oxysporum f. sp. vasinfectum 25433]|uniref:Uncharacterized protein n=1 Tax=Fusarium oxysporum f. sp. vasinfectum 25433 TaxID=1089449 RepID=X0L6E2_FUSOX|nr:hypothetical protein FOTG_10738 [Fusarium oxysporum f. sp. vasinfectum 25433]